MVLGIYGSSGLGQEVLGLVYENGSFSSRWDKKVFVDDSRKCSVVKGIQVYTFEESLSNYTANISYHVYISFLLSCFSCDIILI